uniref:Uncharacterized protein n=1 Tax=Panagrolaimus sp. ES5 TaxID=591445 RepID=A0AC34FFP2_9BILA
MIAITMGARIPLAVNTLINFMDDSSEYTFSFIHDCCICANAFIQFIMALERTVATVCASNYEKVNHKFCCIIGLGFAVSNLFNKFGSPKKM